MPRAAVREQTAKIVTDGQPAAVHHADDETRLRQLGYKQELRRELNLLRNFAVSFGLLSMLTGLGGFYYYDTFSFAALLRIFMAEICSSLPTTGGVYYWAGVLGGKQGPLWSWVVGWLNLLGQVGITAGVEWTVVRYLEYFVNMFKAPDAEPFALTKVQFWLMYSAFILLHGAFNAVSVRLLGFLSLLSVVFHVVGTLVIVIGLPIIAKTHQSASWVFGHFQNYGNDPEYMSDATTGISNSFYSFLLGLLLSQWAMVGYDSSAHIAEETKNAAVAGPVGLVTAILGSFVCGWAFLISLTFCIQNESDGIAGTQQIFMSVFQGRYGSYKGAAIFQAILLIASNFCGIFCVTSNSRMLYAFSRDKGIFGWRWWKEVNSKTGTPVNSIIAMCLAAIVLGLPYLGSDVAFTAISSIGIIGLEASYIIPIFLRLTVARKWFKKGPFHLGAFSIPMGWIAVVWGCFISVVLILPTAYPIVSTNFNYAVVMLCGTIILSMIAWFISARKWFKGPVRNVDTGNKTETLAEAAMRGELDETDSAFGNESGSKAGDTDAAELPADQDPKQFVVA